MTQTRKCKHEIYNDHFQNYRRYAIPKAQLVIADIPYNIGKNAYGSNPNWYVGGEIKNGQSSLMSSETAEKISQMMSYNVSYAYGNSLFPDMSVCAKTGTAEVGGENSHAWFAGFLDDDKNPYAFVVMVENGGGGLIEAAPVASRLLQAAIG